MKDRSNPPPASDEEEGDDLIEFDVYAHLFCFVVLSSVLRVVPTAAGGAYLACLVRR